MLLITLTTIKCPMYYDFFENQKHEPTFGKDADTNGGGYAFGASERE